ncbi:MAG: hypothetical protein KDD67_15680 [Ignavibacteriae bacterium]|nr:hypothetical protein [Ignavibacteriota bacterium]MCB9215738.1 hypothetical protein [Ignavibacteria bacterium]
MKRNHTLIALLAMTFSTFAASCGSTTDPDIADNSIDPALVGAWYRVYPHSADYPSPKESIRGLQFTAGGDVHELAVRTTTGELTVMNFSQIIDLLKANNSRIVWTAFYPPALNQDTLQYEVKGNTLKLIQVYSPYSSDTTFYQRATIDNVITDPILSTFTATIEGTAVAFGSSLNSLEIYPHPAAYASRISATKLLISATHGWKSTSIEIDNFKGVGTYELPPGKEIMRVGDDYVERFVTDSTAPSTVTIDEYDEGKNLCSGTFNLSMHTLSPINQGSVDVLKVNDGEFSLPIYR